MNDDYLTKTPVITYPLKQTVMIEPQTHQRATIIFDLNGVILGLENGAHYPSRSVAYRDVSIVNPHDVLRLLLACKQRGHTLMVLSNAKKDLLEILMADPKAQRIFECFDDIILRSETGLMKDNPETFTYVLEKHDLDPATCVFIDDQKSYLETAHRAGITRTILCTDFNLAAVRSELMRYGVL